MLAGQFGHSSHYTAPEARSEGQTGGVWGISPLKVAARDGTELNVVGGGY